MQTAKMNRNWIEKQIPHATPFLFLDQVLEINSAMIRCRYTLRSDDELLSLIYQGHYPQKPITPGILLCEMMFQDAGVLLATNIEASDGTPLLTRIKSAKFKQAVYPGDTLEIMAKINEYLDNVYYMQGTVQIDSRLAVQAIFACALVKEA